MTLLTTPRLSMRPMRESDADFFLTLVNTPGWLANIGDRNIHSSEAARAAILAGPMAMQEHLGYSLYAVARDTSPALIGMCGLIKRPLLPGPDIGYGFLPEYWGQGYAFEAASRVLSHARDDIGLRRVFGLAAPHNAGSIRILEKLGLRLQNVISMNDSDRGTLLFARALYPARARAGAR